MAASSSRTLKIKFDGDSTGLASATSQAGATLERFDAQAETTRKGLDRVSGASEGLADNSSLATGALGALASGFELVGLEGYAQRLQQAALATDFMSGVGDSLDLVMNRLGISTLKAKVVTTAQTVATKAQTVATKAATVAQRALNLVLRANPIGLVITAIAGLVAVIVLAYKKSETFRRIVDAAFSAVRKVAVAVFGAIRDAAGRAWDWITSNFPKLLGIITTPFKIARGVVSGVWDAIRSGASAMKNAVTNALGNLVGFVRNLPGRIRAAAGGMWDSISGGFRDVLNRIIGWWNNLSFSVPGVKVPGIGKVGGFTIGTPNIGYLARGGYAEAGRTYVVGERGPELLTMGTSGMVTPNSQLGGVTEVRVFIGEQELRGIVQTEIRESNRGLRRRALAGGTA